MRALLTPGAAAIGQRVWVLVAVVVFGCFLGFAGDSRGDSASVAASFVAVAFVEAPALAGVPEGARELPELRTRVSRTYATQRGTRVAVVAQRAVNFRDAQGVWQPIEGGLVAAEGGGYRNKANALAVRLPADLRDPVRVTKGASWLSFALVGASGSASVAGSTATYAGALPGVTAIYTVTNEGLKETFRLAGPSAMSSFAFAVELSPGLSLRGGGDGGLEVVDAAGVVELAFSPPFMRDAAGATASARSFATEIVRSGSGYEVTVSADRGWLLDPARRFPVEVDPSIGSSKDCTVTGGSAADANFCFTQTADVGFDGAKVSRSVLYFDTSSIPASATILDGRLSVYLESQSSSTPVSIAVHALSRSYTYGVTWNTYDGTNPWTSAGGDFEAQAAATHANVGASMGWYHLHPTQLVERWVQGSSPNHGLLIKGSDESAATVKRFTADAAEKTPYLMIFYQERIGEQRQFTFERQTLNDRMDLAVNVASGNLLLHEQDVHIEGRGLDLEIDRYWNSRTPRTWYLGNGWVMGTGEDVSLTIHGDGSVNLLGPSGYEVRFARNGDGSFTAPTGLDATLVKNADNTYTLTWNKTGEQYRFLSWGGLSTHKDKNGNTLTIERDGWISAILDTHGRRTNFTITGGKLREISDPTGRVHRYAYDASNNLTSYTDPANGITRFEYTTFMLTKITDPKGNVTKLAYDSDERVTSITRVTDPVNGTGPTTTYAYNAGNTVATDPRGHRTTYHYDNEARVTRVVDHLGRETTYTWTANSDLATVTNPAGKTTTATYDTKNNMTSSQSPTGARQRYSYDLSGPHPYYAKDGTDAQGNQTNWSYDANGNLTEKSDGVAPGQNPIRLTYNTNGTLATATDGKGTVTSYSYDSQGNLTGINHPAPLGDVTYSYDALSRVRTETDGKGQVTTYTYDVLDRITKVEFQDGSSVEYGYDLNGNRTSRTDNTGVSSYTYDALNRPTQEIRNGQMTSYTHDAASNLISVTDLGGSVTYEYNQVDELSALVEPGGARTTLVHDVNGNRTETAYPNGVRQCASYDDSERLSSIVGRQGACATGTVLTSFGYGYANGSGADTDLRTSMSSQYPGETAVQTSYSYDGLNRLSSANGLGGSFAYSYDPNGNITQQTENGVTTSYSYNNANQVTSSGSTYDANGNQLTGPDDLSLAYNAKDQTSQINGAGNTYAGTNQWEITNFRGTALTHNLLGINSRTQALNTDRYVRDPNGTLISLRAGSGQSYYYLFDGLGSVAALTDSTGNPVVTYKYEPYGRIFASTGTVVNPWRYVSGYHGPATGLTKFGHRYYDPQQKRWTQRDPIEQPLQEAGWNDYTYVGDSPVTYTDPSGDIRCKRCRRAWRKIERANQWLVEKEREVREITRDIYRGTPRPVRRCIGGAVIIGAAGALVGGPKGFLFGAAAGCALGAARRL